jgi:hypothetical protein
VSALHDRVDSRHLYGAVVTVKCLEVGVRRKRRKKFRHDVREVHITSKSTDWGTIADNNNVF